MRSYDTLVPNAYLDRPGIKMEREDFEKVYYGKLLNDDERLKVLEETLRLPPPVRIWDTRYAETCADTPVFYHDKTQGGQATSFDCTPAEDMEKLRAKLDQLDQFNATNKMDLD